MSNFISELECEEDKLEEQKIHNFKKLSTSFLLITYNMLEVSSKGYSEFQFNILGQGWKLFCDF